MKVSTETIKTWLRRSSIFSSRHAQAREFLKRMSHAGYGIMEKDAVHREMQRISHFAHKNGFDAGVAHAARTMLDPNLTRNQIAQFLFSHGLYRELNQFRKAKKLGLEALGFTEKEIEILNANLES